MLTTYQRKFDKIQTLLVNRNYQLTKLQLKSTGAISYFPNPKIQRMMVPSGQSDQNFTFCGAFLRPNKAGATTIYVDRLPGLNHPSNMLHKGQSYKSLDSSTTTVSLAYPLNADTAEKDQLFLDSSIINVLGSYPSGAEAIVVTSSQPILLGDQLLASDGIRSQDVVVLNVNNPNPGEYDLQLDKPLDFALADGDEVVLQMSSACVWLDVPVQNLSYLAVPVATHIADDKALIVTFVRLKSGSKVVGYYYTMEANTVILGAIPTQAWLTASIDGGVAESQDGTTKLVCSNSDGLHARLELLNTIPASNWILNIRSVSDGYITLSIDETNYIRLDLKAGIQQKLVSLGSFNKLKIFSPQTILIGDILPENAPTSLDVVAHVFNQEQLGSHIIANPRLVGLTLDPSLTWARTGQAKTNAGHRLNPASQKIGEVAFEDPEIRIPHSPLIRYNLLFQWGKMDGEGGTHYGLDTIARPGEPFEWSILVTSLNDNATGETFRVILTSDNPNIIFDAPNGNSDFLVNDQDNEMGITGTFSTSENLSETSFNVIVHLLKWNDNQQVWVPVSYTSVV
jgi:hypothetical protein